MTKQLFLIKPYFNEDQFTANVHMFINNNYPELRGFYFHIPNESATNVIIRMKLVAMGLLKGAPDFLFLKPYTWAMELKMPNGTLSPAQKKLHERWQVAGIPVETAYTPQQVIAALEKHIQ